MTVRIALFGAGRIAQVHAASIIDHPGAILSAVVDPWVEGAEALARRAGCASLRTFEDLVDWGEVDAAVIGSPTDTHIDFIDRCTAMGMAVLCEKPIALDSRAVDRCRQSITGRSVPVMLGFNRRFDPSFAEVHSRVKAGEIGDLQQLTIISRDPSPAPVGYLKTSGGIFRDMTIHDLDMARFFIPNIVSVFARGSAFNTEIAGIGDLDSAVVTLKGAGGELVTIVNSRHCASGYDQRIEAFGTSGSLAAENLRPTTVTSSNAAGTNTQGAFVPFFLERYAAAYRVELDAFVRLVKGEPVDYPDFEDGAAALRLAEACQESVGTGGEISLS